MPQKTPQVCGNPRCCRVVAQQAAPGRPRLYCDEQCKGASRTLRARGARGTRHREALHLAYAAEIASDTANDADQFLFALAAPALSLTETLNALSRLTAMRRDLDDYELAVAQVCRDKGATTADLATAGNISASTVSRRWPDSPHGLDQRMIYRRKRRNPENQKRVA